MRGAQRPLFPEAENGSADAPNPTPKAGYGGEVLPTILGLSLLEGVGQKTIRALLKEFKSVGEIWEADKGRLEQVLRKAKTPKYKDIAVRIVEQKDSLRDRGEQQAARLREVGVRFLWGQNLPSRLREIRDPPEWLFVQGDPGVLEERPAVAVVGTRRPTERGLSAAKKVIRILAAYTVVVVSGLAEGIDEAAHSEALEEGLKNIAFLGHGINVVFPKQTESLRAKIVEAGGAVVSEYLPNERYSKARFVQRNRLQAALSDLLVPVEGGYKSGTAHTVRFAMKYKRKIVGVGWADANGLTALLRESGYPVVPVFTRSGLRRLDAAVQEVVLKAEKEPEPLSRAAKRFVTEASSRCFTKEQARELIGRIERVLEEGWEGVETEC